MTRRKPPSRRVVTGYRPAPMRPSPPLWHRLLVMGGLLGLLAAASLLYYANGRYELPAEGLTVDVQHGGVRAVAEQLVSQGLGSNDTAFWVLARASGLASSIKAGRYRYAEGSTPYSVLEQMARGETVKVSITLVEGLRFSQWRAQLATESALRHETAGLDEVQLMNELGAPGVAAEGQFLPDTYVVSYGTADRVVLRMAYRAMQQALTDAWTRRSSLAAVQTSQEALVLASIVEKETGAADERPLIAGVFGNRLRRGMLLQTDPTVIYGLGDTFNGNLTRADLTRDTPWNTYTRAGLPPTPIAMPGRAALLAATQPAKTEALYFVATGGGRHVFSESLAQHNVAVQQLVRRTR